MPYRLKSKAAMGEVYWQVSDTVRATLGLRYTDDFKEVINYPVLRYAAGSGFGVGAAQSARFKETTGRFNVDWSPELTFTDRTLVYAAYSKGYKGGGFNPPSVLGLTGAKSAFDPEFVNAYEVGTKNTLAGGALVVNLTGFYYDYQGYQVAKIINGAGVNENINATVKGAELETVWQATRRFRFNANLAYLDTSIGNSRSLDVVDRAQGDPALIALKAASGQTCVANAVGVSNVLARVNAGTLPEAALLQICSGTYAALGAVVSPGNEVNLKGNDLPNAPRWSVSVGAQYSWPLTDKWEATLRGDYYRQTKSFGRIYNAPVDKLEAWDNLNASLILSDQDHQIDVQLFVRNAFNKSVITDFSISDNSLGDTTNAFVNEPRVYGVGLTKRF